MVAQPSSAGFCPADLAFASRWFPQVQVVGREQIPVLAPPIDLCPPAAMIAFDRIAQAVNPAETFLHFYVADSKLCRIAVHPEKYVSKFARFAGLITPDFSLLRGMPPHQRIRQVWLSRAVGAFYQAHGLNVIANIRWADRGDFDYCFAGVPVGSVVAVSTHGCMRNVEDRFHFRQGLHELLDYLRPRMVFVHGPMPPIIFDRLMGQAEFRKYPSDIERAHRKVS